MPDAVLSTTWIDPTHIAPLLLLSSGLGVSFNVRSLRSRSFPPNMEGLSRCRFRPCPSDMVVTTFEGLKSTLPTSRWGSHMSRLPREGSPSAPGSRQGGSIARSEKEVSSSQALPVILQFPHAPARPVESDEE